MANQVHACVSCAEVFPSAWEKASHWAAAHHRGRVVPDERIRRTSFCWRCASEIPVGVLSCACGFTHHNNKGENK